MSNIIELQGCSKQYGTQLILQDLDLQIGAGQIVALLGKSGSGKSTLLKCLNLLETFDRGTATILGNYYDFSNKKQTSYGNLLALRKKIGIVFQNYSLWSHLSVLDNLCLAPMYVLNLSKEDAIVQAMQLLSTLDMAHKAHVYPNTLSGGQKQRVAIARSLMMKPSVMLFDEPTSALDPAMSLEILKIILELKKQHITSIVATHEMNFINAEADKIYYIEEGNMIDHSCTKKPNHHFVKKLEVV